MSSETPLQEAINKYHQGDTEDAMTAMQEVLISEPENPQVRIEFANILMREKRFDDARDLLNSLSDNENNNHEAMALLDQLDSIDTIVDAPDMDMLIKITTEEPSNCLAREQLCAHHKLRGDYAAAMKQLLEIVRIDRSYNDDSGRTELLKLFDLLGQHELVSEYRRKLAQTLN